MAESSGRRRVEILISSERPLWATLFPAAVRATGRLCYASSNRAVTALDHLWRYARYRQRRGL